MKIVLQDFYNDLVLLQKDLNYISSVESEHDVEFALLGLDEIKEQAEGILKSYPAGDNCILSLFVGKTSKLLWMDFYCNTPEEFQEAVLHIQEQDPMSLRQMIRLDNS